MLGQALGPCVPYEEVGREAMQKDDRLAIALVVVVKAHTAGFDEARRAFGVLALEGRRRQIRPVSRTRLRPRTQLRLEAGRARLARQVRPGGGDAWSSIRVRSADGCCRVSRACSA